MSSVVRSEAGAAAGAGGEDLSTELQRFEGMAVGPPTPAPDPVDQAMIRHWVEAMGDENPVYVDDEVARANGFSGVVAPPTMLQAWIMRGYRATAALEAERARARRSIETHGGDPVAHARTRSAQDELMGLLDAAGFTSVVATNCEQHYVRPLVLGDHLTASSVIEQVSPRKTTALGEGHFVTTRIDFTDQRAEPVATMRFRILRFRPRSRPSAASSPARSGASASEHSPGSEIPKRPRPAITHDNAFFFEGARQGKLLVQRCTKCSRLRHPPGPACANCGSFEWDTIEASGRGNVYSFVVVHHPQVPGFDYPLAIALVELEEGTRLVADLVGVDPAEVRIGMPVRCEFVEVDPELTLPMFRPVGGGEG